MVDLTREHIVQKLHIERRCDFEQIRTKPMRQRVFFEEAEVGNLFDLVISSNASVIFIILQPEAAQAKT